MLFEIESIPVRIRFCTLLTVGLTVYCGFLSVALRAQEHPESPLVFSVAVKPELATHNRQTTKKCDEAGSGKAECIVFHFTIRNVGDSPLISFTSDCSYSGITPEYEASSGDWKPLPELPRECVANMTHETIMMPGGRVEGDLTLEELAPGFDISSVSNPGNHRMRFVLTPWVCIAAAAGDKCVDEKRKLAPSRSEEVLVHVS